MPSLSDRSRTFWVVLSILDDSGNIRLHFRCSDFFGHLSECLPFLSEERILRDLVVRNTILHRVLVHADVEVRVRDPFDRLFKFCDRPKDLMIRPHNVQCVRRQNGTHCRFTKGFKTYDFGVEVVLEALHGDN